MNKLFNHIIHKSLPILFIVCISHQPSQAQFYIKILGYKADTIYRKLHDASASEKMYLYNQLAFYHSLSDADSALFYANQAMRLAEKFENQIELGSAYRHMGNAHALAGNYREAVMNLQQALNIFIAFGETRKIAELYVDLGKLNYDLEDFNKALYYADKFMRLSDQETAKGISVASPVEKAIITGMVAGAAREADDFPLAEKYFKEYIKMSKSINIPASLHTAYIKSLGETFDFEGRLDSALKYTYMARSYLPENKDKPFERQTGYEGPIGSLLIRQGFPDQGFPLLRQSYGDEYRTGSFYYAASSALQIGDFYMDTGLTDSAYYWYQRGMDDANKVYLQMRKETSDESQQIVYSGYQVFLSINQKEVKQRYYRLKTYANTRLYRFFKKNGDHAKALEFFENTYRYKDSLNQVIMNLEERKAQVRFESERMEQQLQLMEQETDLAQSNVRQTRIFLFGISGFLVAILFMVLIYIRQNRLKTEQDRIILQQRLFRSQMNPHFLYNSLASIQNFIVTEDPDNASIYLSKFSNLVRSILDSSNEEFVALDKEIRLIRNYLALQKVRFPDKFDYNIDIDFAIDIESVMIPPMLAQPFIENAIEHGIKHKKDKGRIEIRIRRSFEQLNNRTIEQSNSRTVEQTIRQGADTVFEVEDDGIGRQKARDLLLKQEESHTSMATDITRERIAALNKKYRTHITLEIVDLKDEEGEARGTMVRFVIPFEG